MSTPSEPTAGTPTEPSQRREARVLIHDLYQLLQGYETTIRTTDGEDIRVRLYTADEFMQVHQESCAALGVQPSLTHDRAVDLTRPLVMPR